MKCREIRRYLSPYLDSELDATTTYEISRHLGDCAECARLFSGEGEVEEAIARRLREPRGDEGAVFQQALARTLPRPRRALAWWSLLAAALLILAVQSYRTLSPRAPEAPDLLAMVARDHGAYLRGEIHAELAASEPEEVLAFLTGRLDEDVGALPRRGGWSVEGARVCRFQDAHVGLVMLRYEGVLVSVADLLVRVEELPPEDLASASRERCFELVGGRGVIGLTPRGVRAVFGDVEMARLQEALDAAR